MAVTTLENILGNENKAAYQHLHGFPQCFQQLSFLHLLKRSDCLVKGCFCFS